MTGRPRHLCLDVFPDQRQRSIIHLARVVVVVPVIRSGKHNASVPGAARSAVDEAVLYRRQRLERELPEVPDVAGLPFRLVASRIQDPLSFALSDPAPGTSPFPPGPDITRPVAADNLQLDGEKVRLIFVAENPE